MNELSLELMIIGVGIMVTVHLAFAGWVVSSTRHLAGIMAKLNETLTRLSERLAITETNVRHIADNVKRLEDREERHEREDHR